MKYKKCSQCGKKRLALIESFNSNKKSKDGLSSWCRKCKREKDKIYSREYRQKNPEWKKEDNKRNKNLIKKLVEEYREKYPEREIAKYKLRQAIKKGKVKKKLCEICGERNVHGHHQDYLKPLEVIWLCAKHHKYLHNNIHFN